jgi:hypothetical protein
MPNMTTAHQRLCAAAGLASVAAHAWMAFGHSHAWWQSTVMLLMAAFCLPCAVKLWRRAAAHPAVMLLWSAVGMAGLHVLLLAVSALSAGAHSHHAASVHPAAPGPLLAVIGLELMMAALAASWLYRLRLSVAPPACAA